MKEIVERLQENRNIEVAKSILESAGYRVSKKVNELDNNIIDIAIETLDSREANKLKYDMMNSPEEYELTPQFFKNVASLLGIKSFRDVVYIDNELLYNAGDEYLEAYKILMDTDFYEGSEESIAYEELVGDVEYKYGDYFLITSPLGKILKWDNFRSGALYMSQETRDNVIEHLKKL